MLLFQLHLSFLQEWRGSTITVIQEKKTLDIGAIFPRNNSLRIKEGIFTSIAFVSILVNLNGIFSGNFSLVIAT